MADGDRAARAMEAGAQATMKETELTQGIHEDSKPGRATREVPFGENTTGNRSIFDSTGVVGKQFTTEGAIGGTANKIGGPLDKDGMVGKQFKDTGSIGGSIKDALGSK